MCVYKGPLNFSWHPPLAQQTILVWRLILFVVAIFDYSRSQNVFANMGKMQRCRTRSVPESHIFPRVVAVAIVVATAVVAVASDVYDAVFLVLLLLLLLLLQLLLLQ